MTGSDDNQNTITPGRLRRHIRMDQDDTLPLVSTGRPRRESCQDEFDEVDFSNGRIRPVRTRRSLEDLENDALRHEIRSLRLEQEHATRGLMILQMEQFRLRHQQMMILLEFLQENSSILQDPNDTTLQELQSALDDISSELFTTRNNLSVRSGFDQLLEMLDGLSFLSSSESRPIGATETQLSTLQTRLATTKDSENCSICLKLTEIGKEQASMSCNHWHCTPCITEWLQYNNACPVCRLAIEPEPDVIN